MITILTSQRGKDEPKRLLVEFVAMFAVALVTAALVAFLWNLIGHGESTVDWETSFSFAITFSIILTWTKLREIKWRQRFQSSSIYGKQENKMKKLYVFTTILIALTACTALQMETPEPAVTDMPQVNMPNPASAYCTQNGNTHEIRMAADGSQSGVCIFPDGSTCDEWAYYRGACVPGVQSTPTSALPVETTITVENTGENTPGSYMPPEASEEIVDWWGVIKSTEPGTQFDDYFERQDLGQIIYFGIDSMDPDVKPQIEALRDSGKIVHLYGTLVSNVPDYNGSQIQVARIEIEK